MTPSIQKLDGVVSEALRSSVNIPSLAQAVEELVLNSIDAGATSVDVNVDVVRYQLEIRDNGCGFSANDLQLASQRYCTSKIASLEDLYAVSSFGFRGEALSSIASMSVLEIVTRTKSSGDTLSKIVKNGQTVYIGKSKTQRAFGTTIIVRDIFNSLPVRRKRLSQTEEFEKIKHRLQRIALCHYHVSFKLFNSAKASKSLETRRVKSLKSSFAQLFGAQFADTLHELSYSTDRYTVEGVMTMPNHTHHSKDLQFLFLNGRFVKKTALEKRVNEMYLKCLRVLDGQCLRMATTGSASSRSNMEKQGTGTETNASVVDAHKRRKTGGQAAKSSSSPAAKSMMEFETKWPIFALNIKCSPLLYDVTIDPDKTLVEFIDWNDVLGFMDAALESFLVPYSYLLQDVFRIRTVLTELKWKPTAVDTKVRQNGVFIGTPKAPDSSRSGTVGKAKVFESICESDEEDQIGLDSSALTHTSVSTALTVVKHQPAVSWTAHVEGEQERGQTIPPLQRRKVDDMWTFARAVRPVADSMLKARMVTDTPNMESYEHGYVTRPDKIDYATAEPSKPVTEMIMEDANTAMEAGDEIDSGAHCSSVRCGSSPSYASVPMSPASLSRPNTTNHIYALSPTTIADIDRNIDASLQQLYLLRQPDCADDNSNQTTSNNVETHSDALVHTLDSSDTIRLVDSTQMVRPEPASDLIQDIHRQQVLESIEREIDLNLNAIVQFDKPGDVNSITHYSVKLDQNAVHTVYDSPTTEQDIPTTPKCIPSSCSVSLRFDQFSPAYFSRDNQQSVPQQYAAILTEQCTYKEQHLSASSQSAADGCTVSPAFDISSPIATDHSRNVSTTSLTSASGPVNQIWHVSDTFSTRTERSLDCEIQEDIMSPSRIMDIDGDIGARWEERKRPAKSDIFDVWQSPKRLKRESQTNGDSTGLYAMNVETSDLQYQQQQHQHQHHEHQQHRHQQQQHQKSGQEDSNHPQERAHSMQSQDTKLLCNGSLDHADRRPVRIPSASSSSSSSSAAAAAVADDGVVCCGADNLVPSVPTSVEALSCNTIDGCLLTQVPDSIQQGVTEYTAFPDIPDSPMNPIDSELSTSNNECNGSPDLIEPIGGSVTDLTQVPISSLRLPSLMSSESLLKIKSFNDRTIGQVPMKMTKDMLSQLRVIDQVDCKFILVVYDPDKTLIAVDQHAMHERIRLESLSRSVFGAAGSGSNVGVENLNSAVKVTITAKERDQMQLYRQQIERWGFRFSLAQTSVASLSSNSSSANNDMSSTSPNTHSYTCLVTTVPVVEGVSLHPQDIRSLVMQLSETATGGDCKPHSILRILNYKACRGAIKFGDSLSREQCCALLSQLAQCNFPFQCAHGRPTLYPLLQLGGSGSCPLKQVNSNRPKITLAKYLKSNLFKTVKQ